MHHEIRRLFKPENIVDGRLRDDADMVLDQWDHKHRVYQLATARENLRLFHDHPWSIEEWRVFYDWTQERLEAEGVKVT